MANETNIRKWVEALESGDYRQGYNMLRDPRGAYCCLGVACEVAIANGVNIVGKPGAFNVLQQEATYVYGGNEGWTSSALPDPVRDWLGLTSTTPLIAYGRSHESIGAVKANDVLRWSFMDIAKELRRLYLKEDVDG